MVPHRLPRTVECCNDEDYCNDFLDPLYVEHNNTLNSGKPRSLWNIINLIAELGRLDILIVILSSKIISLSVFIDCKPTHSFPVNPFFTKKATKKPSKLITMQIISWLAIWCVKTWLRNAGFQSVGKWQKKNSFKIYFVFFSSACWTGWDDKPHTAGYDLVHFLLPCNISIGCFSTIYKVGNGTYILINSIYM